MSYKLNQTPIAGESFTRCPQVIIDNQLGKTPRVTFHQETIIGTDGGQVMHMPASPLPLAFDPAAVIPIIDPETGADTGQTTTQGEIYALVYSAYLATANPPIDPTAGEV
ncbi:hypothetical protein [Sediminimonas sp.]|uniref:hypothetical protein n=1 Tax=Sediminimonas sp. TaxID=2823379 RepID=UPI0025D0FF7D|nr:hypothetical protein [Sediminimonas sp.]